jgi:hypothetical protein
VNLVNLTLLLLLLGGGYAAYLFIPLWLDDLDMREAVAAAFGQTSTNPDDNYIRAVVLQRARSVGTHWEEQDGKQVELPGLGVEPGDVVIERKAEGGQVRVAVDYTRTVRLRPLQRFYSVAFHTEKSGTPRP